MIIEVDVFIWIFEDLVLLEDELIIFKWCFSVFIGSYLEVYLCVNDINYLVLMGVFISGVVLSMVLESVDKDYYIIVLEDVVGDRLDDKYDFIIE